MSGLTDRARALLNGITPGPWAWPTDDYLVNAKTGELVASNDENTAFIAAAPSLVADLLAEVERLSSYRSLPDGYVWQDYYSPDEVIRIREPLEAEVDQALEERDQARAAVARVQELCDDASRGPLYERVVRAALAGEGEQ